MSEKMIRSVLREHSNGRSPPKIAAIVRIPTRDVVAILNRHCNVVIVDPRLRDPKGKIEEKRILSEYRKYKEVLLGKMGSASRGRTIEIDPVERDRLEKLMNGG